tara:strand:+ start:392 stop:664 length:273 start_codon:yes stop_codon:yes gene_type:complete
MMSLLSGLLLFAYGTLLPGLALAFVLFDEREPLALSSLGLGLGLLVLPLLHFSLAILLDTHIHPTGITATSTVVLAVCLLAHRRRSGSSG